RRTRQEPPAAAQARQGVEERVPPNDLLTETAVPPVVRAPFPDVAEHVEEAEVVRLEQPAGPGPTLAVRVVARVGGEQVVRRTIQTARGCTAAASVFPFFLGGKPVTGSRAVIGRQADRAVLRRRLVTPLPRGQPGAFAQPVAVRGGIVVRDRIDGTL